MLRGMGNKYLSTTALSKELSLAAKDVFKLLEDAGLVKHEENHWVLTDAGKEKGGVIKTHPQYGSYIAWLEDFKTDSIFTTKKETPKEEHGGTINATDLGAHFGISKFRINPILSELGFIEKGVKGWKITQLGTSMGGKQFEYEKTGIPYVCWCKSLLNNKIFLNSIKEYQGDTTHTEEETKTEAPVEHVTEAGQAVLAFREKFEAKHRSADGHYVRSRAEMLIDNWLYMSEIVHAYERKLPVEEDVYCDFYLPVGKVYIEFWGLENDPKYIARKQEKLKIYGKYNFNLIEINDEDIQNLDDVLPKKLLKFGIQAY
jgi:hypothetical protein